MNLSEFLPFLLNYYSVPDWLSVFSFITALVTLTKVSQSKKLVIQATNDLRRSDALIDFTVVINDMDEVKKLLRDGESKSLPGRYSDIRRKLKTISKLSVLSEDERRVMQDAITQFASFEKSIEDHLANKTAINIPKFNSIVNRHIDNVQDILEKLRASRELK